MGSRVLRSVLAVCVFVCAVAGDALAATGDLTQKAGTAGCISETGSGGACADGTSLSGTFGVTVSPDGKNAYVAGGSPGGVAVFDRASDGTLTQKAGTAGCISDSGNGGACVDGRALALAVSVTVSSDGKSAYVASVSRGAVAVFDRAGDGTLTQKAGHRRLHLRRRQWRRLRRRESTRRRRLGDGQPGRQERLRRGLRQRRRGGVRSRRATAR